MYFLFIYVLFDGETYFLINYVQTQVQTFKSIKLTAIFRQQKDRELYQINS